MSDKKPAFFGDGDAFGDGGGRVYLGRTAEQLADAVKAWAQDKLESSVPDGDGFNVAIEMMTDEEVEALPEI